MAAILSGAIIVREEISCLRDRNGAGVSLLRPVQTLFNPPLSLLGAKDCGGLFGWEKGLCWQGALDLGIIESLQYLQNVHVTK